MYHFIVNTIGTIDDLIEKKEKVNKLIDAYLLKYINKTINENSCKEISLSEIATIKNGYAFKPSDYLLDDKLNEKLEVLKMGHIDKFGGLKINPKKDYVEFNPKYNKWILNKNDIVLGMTDMKDNVVILGVPAIIDESNKYVLNQRVAQIIVDDSKINSLVVYYQMRTNEYINELRKYANSGVQVNLTTESIKNSKIKLFKFDMINENKIKLLYEIFINNRSQIKKLSLLKTLYLNKYFS